MVEFIITVLITIFIIYLICNKEILHQQSTKTCMSFKASSDLVGLPIITFYSNKQKLHFLLDTGADKSAFSKAALNLVEHRIVEGSGTLTDAGGKTIEVGIAYLRFYYENKPYDNYFQLVDMQPISDAIGLKVKGKQIDIVGIIGDDFLAKYKYVLDFEKMIAYSKI